MYDSVKEKLKEEGFQNIFEWSDNPGVVYPAHAHKGKVSFYIVSGSVEMDFSDKKKIIKTGERFDVPVGINHTAIVGPEGCTFIVGEEIEGDA